MAIVFLRKNAVEAAIQISLFSVDVPLCYTCAIKWTIYKIDEILHESNLECYFRKDFTPLCKALLGLVSAIDSLCSKSKAVVRGNRLNVMKESHFISLLLLLTTAQSAHI